MPRLISGGACGADACFEECATAKGHNVTVVSFQGHLVTAKPENVTQFTHEQLERYTQTANKIASIISKSVPNSGYTRWLLLRNMVVASKVDRMFAVISTCLLTPKEQFIGVPGGTGWTAQCFALEHIFAKRQQDDDTLCRIPLWVFDNSYRWYQLVYQSGETEQFVWQVLPIGEKPPKIEENTVYAGIGSREFSTRQREAVASLFV